MGNSVVGPLPSRRVLDELRPFRPQAGRAPSPVAQASADLDAALAAHAAALLAVDRAEAALFAARAPADASRVARAHPRSVAGDDGAGSAQHAWEANDGPARPRRGRGLGSKRRAFMVRHARQLRLDRRARVRAARLLSAPAAGPDDIATKLAVVIAAGEAGPPDAAAFPWARLRQILAELLVVANPGT